MTATVPQVVVRLRGGSRRVRGKSRGRYRLDSAESEPAAPTSSSRIFVRRWPSAPLIYLISPAFRDSVSLFAYPPQWIPSNPSLENYRFLFAHTGYAPLGPQHLISPRGRRS